MAETQELAEAEAQPAEVSIDHKVKEIEEGLSEVRKEFGQTSEDMKSTVSSLQNAVIEIRSAVSEIENPFNVLRLITSEKDLEGLPGTRVADERMKLPKPEENLHQRHETSAEELQDIIVEEDPVRIPPTSTSRAGLTLLRWIWDLIELGLDEEDIASLSIYCEYIGYLPDGSARHVAALAPMAVKARNRGMSREELVLNIYAAASVSGVEIMPDDVNEAIIDVLRLARENGRAGGG